MTAGREQATDPDVDLGVAAQRSELRDHAPILAVITAGGILGALARYQTQLWWPALPGRFDWAIFTVNVTGCLIIGAFMVLVAEIWSAHPLLRPFFATGILGGFTTFSAYAGTTRDLLTQGHTATAVAYLAATAAAAVLATWAAAAGTRRLLNRRSNR